MFSLELGGPAARARVDRGTFAMAATTVRTPRLAPRQPNDTPALPLISLLAGASARSHLAMPPTEHAVARPAGLTDP